MMNGFLIYYCIFIKNYFLIFQNIVGLSIERKYFFLIN